MTRTTLAVAADYADALLVARRSKNVLFLLLLLAILLQIAVFVLYRTNALHVVSSTNPTSTPAVSTTVTHDAASASTDATTQSAPTVTTPAITPSAVTSGAQPPKARGFEITLGLYRWMINVTSFLGVTLIIVLAVVLLLTSIIMLVGRLIGVSHVTSAFVWCALLAVLLFPWQSLLNSGSTPEDYGTGSSGAYPSDAGLTSPVVKDQKLPGILYTWTEVERESRFPSQKLTPETVLHWARFAGWPVVAILLLLIVQTKSGRGLRFALGESEALVDTTVVKPVVDTEL